MTPVNKGRLLLAALVAGVVYFISDGVIHGALLGQDYRAAFEAAGKPLTEEPTSYAYFALFDFGKGLVALLFYVAARASLGPGPKTAAWAGVVAWLATEALPAIAAMPMPFFTKMFYVKVIGLEVLPMVGGAILGAWTYKVPAGK